MTLLAVERIKLVSTRSPWWCAGIALLITLGFTALFVANSDDLAVTVGSTQFAFNLGMIIIMVMAALAITTEYRFSTIKTTFQAAPNRTAVLAAKAAVVALAAGVVGEITAFATYGLARLMKPAADLGLDNPAEWRQVAGIGLIYFFAAILALGVGILVRQSAAAISILLVYTLLVENLIVLIPTVGEQIQKWMPFTAANHFATAGIPAPVEGQGPPLLDLPYGPWGGLAYFAAISVAILVAGIVVTNRRDA
ncbi:MAG: ABC transporter permease [Pseudonocardiales bacterium]|nr:ABC transporter permease [Pseudonocardiales bacterium]